MRPTAKAAPPCTMLLLRTRTGGRKAPGPVPLPPHNPLVPSILGTDASFRPSRAETHSGNSHDADEEPLKESRLKEAFL